MDGQHKTQKSIEQGQAPNDGQDKRQAKRKRVSKACDRCHHAKIKCNGALPRCGTCVKANKACSYAAGMKRRGLRTGYVRALEGLWGLIFPVRGRQ
ncbi:hypothetical protein BDV19DRAFT_355572 [Aspergillus venezuelensis]